MHALVKLQPLGAKYERPEKSLEAFLKVVSHLSAATMPSGVERFGDTTFLIDLDIASDVFARVIAAAANTAMACEMRLLNEVPAKWLPLITAD